jgi:hypothetical protein
MKFKSGDRVQVESESTERPARTGVVEEVVHGTSHPRYRIRWDDGHESIYTPAAGALRAIERELEASDLQPFVQAVRAGDAGVMVAGDVAWATSTSVARGEFRGRPINSAGVELMVLRRTPEGWRIAAIHWSSRALRS